MINLHRATDRDAHNPEPPEISKGFRARLPVAVPYRLEYDIAAMARTLPDLERELHRVIECHIALDRQEGRPPFASIQKASGRFWKMWEKSEFRLEKQWPPRPSRGGTCQVSTPISA
ncbi:MAG TPA: hypothetical protein VG891_13435 [Rhizomicrobium sp.]|nr:hypothetical protein [Rhizomicrobium sp.]